MAGRKPTLAVSAFLQPIRRALRCLTETPLTVSAMHHYELDKPYSWSLNDAIGVCGRRSKTGRFCRLKSERLWAA